jgi:hypothetical protein
VLKSHTMLSAAQATTAHVSSGRDDSGNADVVVMMSAQ